MDLNFRVESTDRRALGLQLLRNLLMKSMESVLAAMHELARGLEEVWLHTFSRVVSVQIRLSKFQ